MRMIVFPPKPSFRLRVMRLEKREVGYSVRYDVDLASWHVMNGTEKFASFFRHDDDLRRNIDDLSHHVVLHGRRLREHCVERGHDRHFETGQELEDVASGLTAEDTVLMLKAGHVEAGIVQALGRVDIVAAHLVADLEAHS